MNAHMPLCGPESDSDGLNTGPMCQVGGPPVRDFTVNTGLTARSPVDSREYAAFACRILRAYARRVTVGDIDALTDMAELAGEIDAATRQAVTGLRMAGYSWSDIGARLGVTRQAVQQRYGRGDN